MSNVPRWEWTQAILSEDGPNGATVRLTLLGLARHMDGDGRRCFPSIERLAKVTHLSDRTVRRSIRQAEASGWLARLPRGRGYQYRPQIPVTVTGNGVKEHRSERPESDEIPVTVTGNGVKEHRSERPESDEIPVTVTGNVAPEQRSQVPESGAIPVTVTAGYRSERPVEVSSTNEVGTTPSLRSGRQGAIGDPVNPRGGNRVREFLLRAAEMDPAWKLAHPDNGGEVVVWWIELRAERPPRGIIAKQAKAGARLAEAHTRQDIMRAMVGIDGIFPHSKESKGEPWDLFDLEQRFSKAYDGFMNHPEVREWKFRRDMERAVP